MNNYNLLYENETGTDTDNESEPSFQEDDLNLDNILTGEALLGIAEPEPEPEAEPEAEAEPEKESKQ